MASTYCFEPPSTVRQFGWLPYSSSPWLAKNRAKVTAGMARKVDGSADQIDEPIGTRYQLRNCGDQCPRLEQVAERDVASWGSVQQAPGPCG